MSLSGKSRTQAFVSIILTCLFLSACGFSPLYATRDTNQNIVTSLAAISVETSNDRVNRALRIALEDRLHSNAVAVPEYKLVLTSSLFETDVAIEQDTEVTRTNLTLRAEFVLSDIETGEVVYSAKTFAIVAYNRVSSEFANIIAERDAEERAANRVSEEIHAKLAIHFERQSTAQNAS